MPYLSPVAGTEPTETAVIVAVPAVEPLVSQHRRRLDVAAGWGVPAHVTVLYPFVPPEAVDEQLVAMLAAAVSATASFDCRFARTRWFGDEVLWLEPDPDGPFRRLTSAVWAAFPQHPPYGGAFDDVIPHLTVGETRQADLGEVQAAERSVQPGLPLSVRIDRALLITGTWAADSWRVLHELPLGASADRDE